MTGFRRHGPGIASVLLGVLLLAGLVVTVPPAHGQEESTGGLGDLRVVITRIDAVRGPVLAGDEDTDVEDIEALTVRALVVNEGDEDRSGVSLTLGIHPAVRARSVLQEALDDQEVQTRAQVTRSVEVRDGEDLPPGGAAGVRLTIPAAEVPWVGTDAVHPVVLTLEADGTDTTLVTAVVHLTELPEAPLQTTIVWPLAMTPTRSPSGTYPQAIPDDLAAGGRIDRILAAVEAHPESQVLLSPDAALLQELADRADGFVLADGTPVAAEDPAATWAGDLLARVRTLAQTLPNAPVLGPYAQVDVATLAAGPPPVPDLAAAAVDTARTRTDALLGRASDTTLFVATTPLTSSVIDLTGADHLLVDYDQVDGPSLGTNPDLPDAYVEVDSDDARLRTATVADPHIADLLDGPGSDLGADGLARRLAAETALLQLTAPGQAGRALLVMPPATWDPAPGVEDAVLAALLTSPWLTVTHPNDAVRTQSPLKRALTNSATSLPSVLAAEISGARSLIAALRAARPDGIPELADQTVDGIEDSLLWSLTTARFDDGTAGDAIAAVRRVVESAFGTVEVSEGARITLTSDTGTVPVTLQRTSGGAVEVLVEVDSAGRLIWDDEARSQLVTLPANGSRTVSFSTRAVSRGTFPVTVSVYDPTRTRRLDAATISVRSTAISRTALIAIGGVVAALLLAGVRRRRRPQLEVVR